MWTTFFFLALEETAPGNVLCFLVRGAKKSITNRPSVHSLNQTKGPAVEQSNTPATAAAAARSVLHHKAFYGRGKAASYHGLDTDKTGLEHVY